MLFIQIAGCALCNIKDFGHSLLITACNHSITNVEDVYKTVKGVGHLHKTVAVKQI